MADLYRNPYFNKCVSAKAYFVEKKFEKKGNWRNIFENDTDFFLDIGCGSGAFTVDLAKRHQNYNFIGIDYSIKFLYKAIKKASFEGLKNIRFVCHNAKELCEIFSQDEVDGAYLLFSDPYNKTKQKKHRVLNNDFLKSISEVMKPRRYLIIKTDEEEYFCQIDKEVTSHPNFLIIDKTNDFWESEYCLKDIKSHYEIKFDKKKINWLIAKNIK